MEKVMGLTVEINLQNDYGFYLAHPFLLSCVFFINNIQLIFLSGSIYETIPFI